MIDENDSVIVAPPGPFSLWVRKVIGALAKHALNGPIRVLDVKRAGKLGTRANDVSSRILYYNYPSLELMGVIERGASRILCVTEPPLSVLNHQLRESDLTPIKAIRLCTRSYVANRSLRMSRQAHIIDRSYPMAVRELLDAFCTYFNIDVEPSVLDDYALKLLPDGAVAGPEIDAATRKFKPEPNESGEKSSNPGDDQVPELCKHILDPMAAMLTASELPPIVWSRNVFCCATAATPPAPQVVDLTGPARTLYHGPFLHLPAGTYEAEFIVALNSRAKEKFFRVDAYSGKNCLARARLEFPESGGFTGRLKFKVTNIIPEIQIQFIAERGAIGGEFSLLQVVLHSKN